MHSDAMHLDTPMANGHNQWGMFWSTSPAAPYRPFTLCYSPQPGSRHRRTSQSNTVVGHLDITLKLVVDGGHRSGVQPLLFFLAHLNGLLHKELQGWGSRSCFSRWVYLTGLGSWGGLPFVATSRNQQGSVQASGRATIWSTVVWTGPKSVCGGGLPHKTNLRAANQAANQPAAYCAGQPESYSCGHFSQVQPPLLLVCSPWSRPQCMPATPH